MNDLENIKGTIETVGTMLPETTSEIDGIMSTLFGFVNNVIFLPLKKLNIKCKHNLEEFKNEINKKAKKIPDDQFQNPKLSIVGPALEVLRYYYEDDYLRDYFENLLVSSMDKRTEVFPSFIEILKQLTPEEAKLLKKMSTIRTIPLIDVITTEEKGFKEIVRNFSDIGDGICERPENICAYIENLSRLGIIEIVSNACIDDDATYSRMAINPKLNFCNDYVLYNKRKLDYVRKYAEVTSFGYLFIKDCVLEK